MRPWERPSIIAGARARLCAAIATSVLIGCGSARSPWPPVERGPNEGWVGDLLSEPGVAYVRELGPGEYPLTTPVLRGAPAITLEAVMTGARGTVLTCRVDGERRVGVRLAETLRIDRPGGPIDTGVPLPGEPAYLAVVAGDDRVTVALDGRVVWRGSVELSAGRGEARWNVALTAGRLEHLALRGRALPSSELFARQLVREGLRRPRTRRPARLQPQIGLMDSILDIAVSPDDRMLAAVGRPPAVTLWDFDSGLMLRKLKGHHANVQAVAFSPDGRLLATASDDGTVRIWNIDTGVTRRVFRVGRPTKTLDFFPDGRHVVTGSDDAIVRIWDVVRGQEVRRFEGYDGFVLRVRVNDDATRLAVGAKGLVRVIDLTDGRTVWERRLTKSEHAVRRFAFDPQGRWLALAIGGGIELVDPEAGTVLAKSGDAHSVAVRALAFDSSGKRLLSSGRKDIRLWSMPSGRLRAVMAKPLRLVKGWWTSGTIYAARWSGDEQYIVSGSADGRGDDRAAVIDVWSADGHRHLRQLRSPLRQPDDAYGGLAAMLRQSIASPQSSAARGTMVVTSRNGQPITQWNLNRLRVVKTFGDSLPPGRVELSPGAERLYFVGGRATGPIRFRAWDVGSGQLLTRRDEERRFVSAAIRPAKNVAVVASTPSEGLESSFRLERWPLDGSAPIALPEQRGALFAARVDADARLAMTMSADSLSGTHNKMILWDLEEGEAVLERPAGALTVIAPGPRAQRTWAVAGEEHVWLLTAPPELAVARAIDVDAPVRALRFSGDETLLYGDELGRVFVVDTASTASAPRELFRMPEAIARIDLRDGWLIATGASLTVRVSRGLDGEPVSLLSNDGSWLVADAQGHFDGTTGAMNLLAVIADGRVGRVDQLATQRNRPDVLLDHLTLGDPRAVAHFRARNLYRLKKQGRTSTVTTERLPTVRIEAFEPEPQRASLRAELVAAAGLRSYQVYVNDVATFHGRGRPVEGHRASVEETVALLPGVNKVELSAFDRRGFESLRAVRFATGQARGVRLVNAHSKEVHDLVATRDGAHVVTGLDDGYAELRTLQTGRLVRRYIHRYDRPSRALRALAVDPAQRYLAGGFADKRLRVWDFDSAASVAVFEHEAWVNGVAFYEDRVFSASSDGTVRAWDFKTGEARGVLPGMPKKNVSFLSVAVDRVRARVAASSNDGKLRIWDAGTLELLGTHDFAALAIDAHPSRPMIAGVTAKGRLRVWNTTTSSVVVDVPATPEKALAVRWSPAGDRVAVVGCVDLQRGHCNQASLVLLDEQGRRLGQWQGDATFVGGLAFTPDGRTVLAGWGRDFVAWTPEIYGDARPDLYFVGFGVSSYQDDAVADLGFAHQDAIDLAAAFGRMEGGFRRVAVQRYIDGEVTTASIRAAKQRLERARPQDVVVVFVAGHGLHDRDAAATYYYLTSDARLDDLPGTAASFELIEDLIAGIPPRRKLVLLDTCESGELVDFSLLSNGALPGADRRLVARGLRREQMKASGLRGAGPPRRPWLAERDRMINQDVFRRAGAIVLSSSAGHEASLEDPRLANGIFTEALLEALTTAKADTDANGWVSTDELRSYVTRRVPALTDDAQHSTVDRDNLYQRFAFPVSPAGVSP